MSEPWGVHHISDMYADRTRCAAGMPDGRWVTAVYEPYEGGVIERLRAAWWVFTGRAYAVIWPKPGDLEDALEPSKD